MGGVANRGDQGEVQLAVQVGLCHDVAVGGESQGGRFRVGRGSYVMVAVGRPPRSSDGKAMDVCRD